LALSFSLVAVQIYGVDNVEENCIDLIHLPRGVNKMARIYGSIHQYLPDLLSWRYVDTYTGGGWTAQVTNVEASAR